LTGSENCITKDKDGKKRLPLVYSSCEISIQSKETDLFASLGGHLDRRQFFGLIAASPLLADVPAIPQYKIVTSCKRMANGGMPGQYPGQAVRVTSEQAVDTGANRVQAEAVQAMLAAGMRELTGKSDVRDAWSQFFSPSDIVGIKVNCSGAPEINSNPELVSAIAQSLISVGLPPEHIYIYDRFQNQMDIVKYEQHVPQGVQTAAAESKRGSILGYDPFTYVETNFFGEDDTRSNLIRLVSEKFTKVINVPTMKEHRAAGVTGCLKNIAYGNFSNVARSHQFEKTNTYSFIGTLASVDPLRSRTVLNVMDGLRSLWQGGPFLQSDRFLFFPKRIVVGTDPVAMDHTLIEMIEAKRREENACSIFDRGKEHIKFGPELDPNYNSFIREPGHVEYAGTLGLGVYDRSKITEKVIKL
jgi:uncharacterized protein (DUF362 family)